MKSEDDHDGFGEEFEESFFERTGGALQWHTLALLLLATCIENSLAEPLSGAGSEGARERGGEEHKQRIWMDGRNEGVD